jgi:hypothetical protein
MLLTVSLASAVALAGVVIYQQNKVQRAQREQHIRTAVLPQGLFAELRKKRPELTQKDCELVAHGLRQFFLAHLHSGRRYVSMPSQIVDELWHAFILHTRNYERFCQHAFGGFLHHSPATSLKDQARSDEGLWRAWYHACKEEHINPYKPTRLPLLFALDSKLKLADGFHYAPDCRAPMGTALGGAASLGAVVHCAADLHASHQRNSSGCGGGSSSVGDGDGGGGCGGCGGD